MYEERLEYFSSAVQGAIAELHDLSLHEISAYMYAAAYELSLRAGIEPRTVFDVGFVQCPGRSDWTKRIAPAMREATGRHDEH